MINAKPTLIRLEINDKSITGAVIDVHNIVDSTDHKLDNALDIIEAITTIRPAITDPFVALTVAQYAAQTAVAHDLFDPQQTIDDAIAHHQAIVDRHPYLLAKAEDDQTVTEIEGAQTRVVIKSNGKIKKGGKQVVAAELYQSRVVHAVTPLDNKQFIQLLIDELGMTKPGATTYAANCRKQFSCRA